MHFHGNGIIAFPYKEEGTVDCGLRVLSVTLWRGSFDPSAFTVLRPVPNNDRFLSG
jgi:hypothetical protein